jgi:hypothetical protein
MFLFRAVCLSFIAGLAVEALEDWTHQLNDKDVAKFLDNEQQGIAESGRLLEEESSGDFGQVCGNRNPCQEGLECSRALGLRGRCFPVKCLEEGLKDIDMNSFKAAIFESSGVAEKEFYETAQGMNRNSFMETSAFSSVVDSLNAHAPLLDESVGKAMRKCAPGMASSKNTTESSGPTNYLGFHLEAGCLVDGQYNFISAGDPENTVNRIEYNRGCFGGEAGLGAEVGLLYGIAYTGNIGDMATCTFFGDLDAGALASGGIAIGIGFNGVTFLEFNGGGGFGFGLGAQFCGTLPAGE